MNEFVRNVKNQESRTENDMKARQSSGNDCVDLFYNIGASRGKDIIPKFVAAVQEDRETALRIAQWARDVRGGAGERKLFRDIVNYLETNDPDGLRAIVDNIPELGRWDDLLVFNTKPFKEYAYTSIGRALNEGNGLTAKWMPRKGETALELRSFLGMTPKQYRKTLVGLTNVVENLMCKNNWDDIDYEKVPSLASARYKRAFERHSVNKFAEYAEKVAKGEAKVNTGAIYPYDVLKTIFPGYSMNCHVSKAENDHIIGQWNSLPNYVESMKNIMPVIDVSGSMFSGPTNVAPILGAVSIGLYVADKNPGAFKDTYLSFSADSKLNTVKGNIISKVNQLNMHDWGMNTCLHSAFARILGHARQFKVKTEDMPEVLLILSDMQFDRCVNYDDSAMEMIERKYRDSGYEMPQIVFWNFRATENTPIKFNKQGAALVSGLSPSILKTVLSGDFEQFTPYAVMMETISSPRYDLRY